MNIFLSKIALVASILLALTFTFSCSSDDDKSDSWLTCNEYKSISTKCQSEYGTDFEACFNDDDYDTCTGAAKDKLDKCMIDACKGKDKNECISHYNQCN